MPHRLVSTMGTGRSPRDLVTPISPALEHRRLVPVSPHGSAPLRAGSCTEDVAMMAGKRHRSRASALLARHAAARAHADQSP